MSNESIIVKEPSSQKVDLSSLCLSCGLCCDGSLFTIVEVTESERQSLCQLGFRTYLSDDNERVFDQPCPRLKDNCCQIYDHRPNPCRKYECYLVQEVESGDVGLSDAITLVKDIRTEQQWIEDNVPISFYLAYADMNDEEFDQSLDFTSPVQPHQNLSLSASYRDFLYDIYFAAKEVSAERAFTPEEMTWVKRVKKHLKIIKDNIHKKKLYKKYKKLKKLGKKS